MNDASHSHRSAGRATTIFLSGVIGIAAVGYCVGISDGVPRADRDLATASASAHPPVGQIEAGRQVIPATTYAEMRVAERKLASRQATTFDSSPPPPIDLQAEIKPQESDKINSTLTRASRRAFNGAPPVIPHAIEKTSDAACYACHGGGMKIGDQVAGQMSHGFLANCTQCHSPPPPPALASFRNEAENTFVGLAAPLKGDRAFEGAPPTIPHSTWMRGQCLSCHGMATAWDGLQSTHPWRTACTQCHAPSASLDQAPTAANIGLVRGPQITEE